LVTPSLSAIICHVAPLSSAPSTACRSSSSRQRLIETIASSAVSGSSTFSAWRISARETRSDQTWMIVDPSDNSIVAGPTNWDGTGSPTDGGR
jgi:hypothetical protein